MRMRPMTAPHCGRGSSRRWWPTSTAGPRACPRSAIPGRRPSRATTDRRSKCATRHRECSESRAACPRRSPGPCLPAKSGCLTLCQRASGDRTGAAAGATFPCPGTPAGWAPRALLMSSAVACSTSVGMARSVSRPAGVSRMAKPMGDVSGNSGIAIGRFGTTCDIVRAMNWSAPRGLPSPTHCAPAGSMSKVFLTLASAGQLIFNPIRRLERFHQPLLADVSPDNRVRIRGGKIDRQFLLIAKHQPRESSWRPGNWPAASKAAMFMVTFKPGLPSIGVFSTREENSGLLDALPSSLISPMART